MAKKVCDFCLSEFKGLFGGPEKLPDGHYLCKDCRSIIKSYGLPLEYDLFQCLVTTQPNLKDMIMDTWLENNDAETVMERFYPYPEILLHDGEHCLNIVKASITVKKEQIPSTIAVNCVLDVVKNTIDNIPDAMERGNNEKVEGTLIETEAALYFLSDHFINCHRLGYIRHNSDDNSRIVVATPSKTFTYKVDHADMFFLRERFFQKVNAALNNKRQHLIYITNDNNVTITPGVYDIHKVLRPGLYKVKAIRDAGLHIKDSMGRVRDYYESEESIDLSDGGILECTGEYQLQWIGEKKKD